MKLASESTFIPVRKSYELRNGLLQLFHIDIVTFPFLDILPLLDFGRSRAACDLRSDHLKGDRWSRSWFENDSGSLNSKFPGHKKFGARTPRGSRWRPPIRP